MLKYIHSKEERRPNTWPAMSEFAILTNTHLSHDGDDGGAAKVHRRSVAFAESRGMRALPHEGVKCQVGSQEC